MKHKEIKYDDGYNNWTCRYITVVIYDHYNSFLNKIYIYTDIFLYTMHTKRFAWIKEYQYHTHPNTNVY